MIIDLLKNLLTKRDRFIICVLLVASILMAMFEALRIAMIMPFISVSTNFDLVNSHPYISYVYNALGFSSPMRFILALGIVVSILYVIQTVCSLGLLYAINSFSQNKYHTTSLKLFKNYLRLDYKEFISKNSAIMHKRIISDSGNLVNIITASLVLFSEGFNALCVYCMLLWVDWKMTLVLSIFFALKLVFIVKPCFKIIEEQGRKSRTFLQGMYRVFNEAFGNFKLIKFLSNERYFSEKFSNSGRGLARAGTFNSTFQAAPRQVLELLAFLILSSIIMYVTYFYNDSSKVIPIVSLYGLAFYRMLPALNRVLGSYNQITFLKNSIDIDDLGLSNKKNSSLIQNLSFDKNIEFSHAFFQYTDKQEILNDVSFIINKGEKVAFIGESGSGKSTLIYLLTGIYDLNKGKILVDGVELKKSMFTSWRSKIGYIPQDTYLFDGTVAQNVVFGREYNEARLIQSLKNAQIYEFLLTQDGLETKVGEGGVKISGGQKQRISIARALYSNPEILILDEASSALDTKTEQCIMDDIYRYSNGKTLIVITHRMSTINKCDKIYKVNNNKVFLTMSSMDGNGESSINVQV